MPSALFFLCVVVMLAGVAFAAKGVRLSLADRRLEARLSAIAPAATPDGERFALPAFMAARGRDRSELEGRLQLAGFRDPRALQLFVWLRLGATAGSALLIMLICRIAWGGWTARPLLIIIGAGLVYVGMKQGLYMLASARSRRVTAEFPFLIDLMLMMLESGVSLDQCFRSIARDEQVAVPEHGPLIGLLIADLDRGMRYEHALDRWAGRVAISGAKELAALFRQAMFQGVELAPALREFAREFTQRRVARAREAMGGITVRMVVLMILFFMPALFIVLGGPPVIAIFDTLRGAAR
ncbi:type II secretion system F family protein [Sphingobium sp. ZW T5_29]|uniref:type II secretion system F family protein n=1 Tax=Sphingobium sp. ZW T5_29 TaxID=3378077 RepID=UPI003852C076